ncbi:MAG: Septum formation protein Maf [Fimbriimonadaceae bacterium]|nr:Septum formation protein Maf [Fimbriimonadaceae bacterium]
MTYPVVLASASPRRQEILARHVQTFLIDPADIDEDALSTDNPWQTAQNLAREKALTVAARHPDSLVIAGDTVVAIPSRDSGLTPNDEPHEMLAKPLDHEDAVRMLERLQDKSHLVVTGLCLKWPKGMKLATETSRVWFRPLAPQDIENYLELGESMDKAGAYAYQGEGKRIVERVDGSETNVIGLPEELLTESLRLVSS